MRCRAHSQSRNRPLSPRRAGVLCIIDLLIAHADLCLSASATRQSRWFPAPAGRVLGKDAKQTARRLGFNLPRSAALPHEGQLALDPNLQAYDDIVGHAATLGENCRSAHGKPCRSVDAMEVRGLINDGW